MLSNLWNAYFKELDRLVDLPRGDWAIKDQLILISPYILLCVALMIVVTMLQLIAMYRDNKYKKNCYEQIKKGKESQQ